VRDATKILYVTINMELGGTERQLFELVTGLDPGRFRPHICCIRSGGYLAKELSKRGLGVTVFGFPPLDYSRKLKSAFLLGGQIFELSRFMRRMRPDIVQCMLPMACVAGGMAARLARAPVLVTGRRGLGHYKEGKPVLRMAENLVNKWSAAVVTNSDAVMADVLLRERIDPRKLRVIRNGVRIPGPPPLGGWRVVAGKSLEGPVVCLVANFFHYKRHRDFVSAAAMILKEVSSAYFVLVGDGSLRGEIEKRISELGLCSRFILLGIRTDSVQIMQLSDIVTLCSCEEGFPNVLLEAMAAGKPVVATRVGGIPEIVEDGSTGILVDPGAPERLAEAIVRLLKDKERAEEMGRLGRERVARNFTIEKMVRTYEELYATLLSEKGMDH